MNNQYYTPSPPQNRCPKCGNIDLLYMPEQKTEYLSWFTILSLLLFVGVGWIFLLIIVLVTSNTTTAVSAVCKVCGNKWELGERPKSALIQVINIFVIISWVAVISSIVTFVVWFVGSGLVLFGS